MHIVSRWCGIPRSVSTICFMRFVNLSRQVSGVHETRIFPPPPLRQLAGGGGEDGLAEAFENGGDAVQAFAAGVYPREDRVELVGDALLFVGGARVMPNVATRFGWARVSDPPTPVTPLQINSRKSGLRK